MVTWSRALGQDHDGTRSISDFSHCYDKIVEKNSLGKKESMMAPSSVMAAELEGACTVRKGEGCSV